MYLFSGSMYHEYKSTIHNMMEVTNKNVYALGHLGWSLYYLHHGQYTSQSKDGVTFTKRLIIIFCIPSTIINHLGHKRFIHLQNTFGKCKHWNPLKVITLQMIFQPFISNLFANFSSSICILGKWQKYTYMDRRKLSIFVTNGRFENICTTQL